MVSIYVLATWTACSVAFMDAETIVRLDSYNASSTILQINSTLVTLT